VVQVFVKIQNPLKVLSRPPGNFWRFTIDHHEKVPK